MMAALMRMIAALIVWLRLLYGFAYKYCCAYKYKKLKKFLTKKRR